MYPHATWPSRACVIARLTASYIGVQVDYVHIEMPTGKPVGPAAIEWHYMDNYGVQQGPVSASELQGLKSSGVVSDTTLVWNDDMPEWMEMSKQTMNVFY